MKNLFLGIIAIASLLIIGCKAMKNEFDASGTFEADETIVSSEMPGKILLFNVEEGMHLSKDSVVGPLMRQILICQQQQVEASINALSEKTANVDPQVELLQNQLAVQQSQLDNLLHERTRIENLLKADAATAKQLDDINAQVDVVKKSMTVTQQQINVKKNDIATQNRSILSEGRTVKKKSGTAGRSTAEGQHCKSC
jgi:HlyD family secretion protein